eukprot:Tbor_TRINITY_DN5463_c1_g3::TRINITY_DN5463_c1_g3_i1::g.25046::m.25046
MRYPLIVFVVLILMFLYCLLVYDTSHLRVGVARTLYRINMGSSRVLSTTNTSLADSNRTAVHNGTVVAIMRERGQCRLLPRGSPSGTVEICLERERRRGCRGVVKVTISDCLLKFKGGMISKNVTLSEELKSLG